LKFSFGIKFSMLVSIHVEKLQALHKIGLSAESGRSVHWEQFTQSAIEAEKLARPEDSITWDCWAITICSKMSEACPAH
jgi:hypothetical protein